MTLSFLAVAVSSQRMQDHFGAKSADWLASWLAIGIVNLVSNFIKPSQEGPWNDVRTSCHEWSDAHEAKTVYTYMSCRIRLWKRVLCPLCHDACVKWKRGHGFSAILAGQTLTDRDGKNRKFSAENNASNFYVIDNYAKDGGPGEV